LNKVTPADMFANTTANAQVPTLPATAVAVAVRVGPIGPLGIVGPIGVSGLGLMSVGDGGGFAVTSASSKICKSWSDLNRSCRCRIADFGDEVPA